MIIKLFIIFVGCSVFCEGQYEGESCTSSADGSPGVCKKLKLCTPALRELKKKKPQLCSFVRDDPVVCCVEEKQNATRTSADQESPCGPLDPTITELKTGKKAHDKCVEYQEKYIYPCERGMSLAGDLARSTNCHHETDKLIIAGKDAGLYEFPHMALLGFGPLDKIKYECGGSIISEEYILTAGHCSASLAHGPLTHVVIGAVRRADTSDPSKIYKVKQFIKYPDYKSPSKYHDIGLVRTEKRMELDQYTVPACLHAGEPVNASRVLAAGWGLMHNNAQELSEVLQKGDSGGPIMIMNDKIHCMYTVVGVTSFGRYCGFGDSPGLYTRVAHYLPWIESVVWPN